MTTLGWDPVTNTPEEFTAQIKSELAIWPTCEEIRRKDRLNGIQRPQIPVACNAVTAPLRAPTAFSRDEKHITRRKSGYG